MLSMGLLPVMDSYETHTPVRKHSELGEKCFLSHQTITFALQTPSSSTCLHLTLVFVLIKN